MVQRDLLPVVGAVAVGADASIVAIGRLVSMAIEAAIKAGVVKENIPPVVGAMAQGALARIVVLPSLKIRHEIKRLLKFMAALAARVAAVIKVNLFPIGVDVAVRALSGIVIVRQIMGQVAGFAVGES